MSCLDATFTLTPRSPFYAGVNQWSLLWCFGADFYASYPTDFSSLYSADRLYFDTYTAGDPNIDYAQWINRRRVPFLGFNADLSALGTAKQLALIFGFEVAYSGRVLVYTDAGLISDQTLTATDSQFLLEIELPSQSFTVYFIHAGGNWFFKGLSGYVV